MLHAHDHDAIEVNIWTLFVLSSSGNVVAAVVNIEDEKLLSSPNQAAEPAEEAPTETGEEGSVDGNPHSSDSSPTVGGDASNLGNVNHASVVEAVHHVVQKVMIGEVWDRCDLSRENVH